MQEEEEKEEGKQEEEKEQEGEDGEGTRGRGRKEDVEEGEEEGEQQWDLTKQKNLKNKFNIPRALSIKIEDIYRRELLYAHYESMNCTYILDSSLASCSTLSIWSFSFSKF